MTCSNSDMANLLPCSSCHRHLRTRDEHCPFCGASQGGTTAATPRHLDLNLGVALMSLALAAPACHTSQGDGSTVADTTETADAVGEDEALDEDDDGAASFYAGPDVDLPPISTCDNWAQDCPEGSKCVPALSAGRFDQNTCVPVVGTGKPGDPCTLEDDIDDCDEDSFCWRPRPDGSAVCRAFCEGSPEQPLCPPDEACLIDYGGSINLCYSPCNPIDWGCEDGQTCMWTGEDFFCRIDAGGGFGLGEPCGNVESCAAGLVCLSHERFPACEGGSCCTQYCDLENPVCNLPGTSCVPWDEEPEPGYEQLGVCLAP